MTDKKSTKDKVLETVDEAKSSEPLTDMPMFMLLPPNHGVYTETLKPAYSSSDTIKMPSIVTNSGPEGFRIDFIKRLYDPNKDPRLVGNRELQDEVIDLLKKSNKYGIDFTTYDPNLDEVKVTRGDLDELREFREARDSAEEKESSTGG